MQKVYRLVFWFGYSLVMIAEFVKLKDDLHTQTLNLFSFHFHLDQVLHTFVYFLICLYFIVGQHFGLNIFNYNPLLKFLVAAIMLAIVTEGVQLFVPYRTFNFFDMLANLIGIGIGVTVICLIRGKRFTQKG